MRVLLRVLAPLLGLLLALAGALLVLELAAAWIRPGAPVGLVVPWRRWRTVLETVTWAQPPVAGIAIGVAVFGLLLVLVGLFARRPDVPLDGPAPEITVSTTPRVLARIVGRRVRATDDVAGASVTASKHKVSVTAQAWNGAHPELLETVRTRVDQLLDELPLHRRPRVSVTLQERRGPR